MVDPVVDQLAQTAQDDFDAQALTQQIQLALLPVMLLGAGVYSFWDKQIVPQKRAELAKDKKTGQVANYLDDIRDNDERKSEQWLFNAWLEPKKQPPAVPFLPAKKFNSGDNPVLVATGALMLPLLFGAAQKLLEASGAR